LERTLGSGKVERIKGALPKVDAAMPLSTAVGSAQVIQFRQIYSIPVIRFLAVYSNRTQVCIVKQYTALVRAYRIFPTFIRSDRGAETPIMADIHYNLAVSERTEQGNSRKMEGMAIERILHVWNQHSQRSH
jgi:hypothetical protein